MKSLDAYCLGCGKPPLGVTMAVQEGWPGIREETTCCHAGVITPPECHWGPHGLPRNSERFYSRNFGELLRLCLAIDKSVNQIFNSVQPHAFFTDLGPRHLKRLAEMLAKDLIPLSIHSGCVEHHESAER